VGREQQEVCFEYRSEIEVAGLNDGKKIDGVETGRVWIIEKRCHGGREGLDEAKEEMEQKQIGFEWWIRRD
jgi:hypothetical protein